MVRNTFIMSFLSSELVHTEESDEWIAAISGLDIGSDSPSEAQIQLLVEYLAGEGGGTTDQVAASRISRLVIAGNSLAPVTEGLPENINTPEERKAVSCHAVF